MELSTEFVGAIGRIGGRFRKNRHLSRKIYVRFANKYLQLFVPAVSGAVVYVVMCVILKSEEFFGILKTVMRKFLKEA